MAPKRSSPTPPPPKASWASLAGVFFLSLSVITFEVSLTRVLSVLLSYHYVFVAISLALLGLGAGGIFLYCLRGAPTEEKSAKVLAWSTSLFALSLPLSVMGLIKTPYSAATFLLSSLLIFLPFFLAGVALAEVLQRFASQSGKVYGADLLGGAAGSLLVIPLLDRLGGISGAFFIGFLAVVAALLFAVNAGREKLWLPAANLVIVGGLFWASVGVPSFFSLAMGGNLEKTIHGALSGEAGSPGRITKTRWSAFGRTDLVEYEGRPDEMDLFLDGTAGSPMYRFDGNPGQPGPYLEALKAYFPGYFPFPFLKPEERNSALIIGPGGGRDVLLTLMGGVEQITAVEINRDLVDIVKEYSQYNGGLYTDFKNVNVVVDEGRSFLQRQKEKYDLIMLSLPVTQSSRSPEGFALTESFLFTKESIRDYLDHLTEEGRLLVVAHHQVEMLRLVSLALSALQERGITEAAALDHLYVVGSNRFPLLVLKKTRFAPEEIFSSHKALHLSRFVVATSYFPYIRSGNCQLHEKDVWEECEMLDPVLTTLANKKVSFRYLERAVATKGFNISPVTDDRPFFYNLTQGVPFSLVVTLGVSLSFVFLAISAPLLYWKTRRLFLWERGEARVSLHSLIGFMLLFSLLGVAFMLAEIPLIQRLTLFLGQPILSFTVLLFSLLLGAGLGSLASARIPAASLTQGLKMVTLGVALFLLAWAFFMPGVLDQFRELPWLGRSLVAASMLLPLGFGLGFPFPLGIRLLKEHEMEAQVPWMWGINGVCSVLGSVAAVVLAMELGFTWVLFLSALGYFLASLSVWGVAKPGNSQRR